MIVSKNWSSNVQMIGRLEPNQKERPVNKKPTLYTCKQAINVVYKHIDRVTKKTLGVTREQLEAWGANQPRLNGYLPKATKILLKRKRLIETPYGLRPAKT